MYGYEFEDSCGMFTGQFAHIYWAVLSCVLVSFGGVLVSFAMCTNQFWHVY